MTDTAASSPVQAVRDDRKTTKAFQGVKMYEGARVAKTFAFSRDVLRSQDMRQAGADAANLVIDNPDHVSFFFLDGEIHRKRRASVAGYFTPKAIVTRYYPLMQRVMDEQIAQFRKKGSAVLDELSFMLAAMVTMEIVGLTGGADDVATARRIKTILSSGDSFETRPLHLFVNRVLFGWFHNLVRNWRVYNLLKKDILPACERRRKEPKDDVISYMVKEDYSKPAMVMEIMSYGGAGVSTTREFMVMAIWQLFLHPDLKERFLKGTEEDQFAILEEMLRLEPLAGYLYRRPTKDVSSTEGPVKEGELLAIDLRTANTDESVAGPNPYQLDPDRGKRMKVVGTYMTFGDGPHRCPGAQVALHESRIFVDRLLRVPGLRLVSEPKVSWSLATQTYELRGAIVACDPT